jgi:lipid-A-disaccharide synthase
VGEGKSSLLYPEGINKMQNNQSKLNIGILAGEASGDLLGASLIKSLRAFNPDLTIFGIGGPAMIAAGCQSLYPMERLSVMGLIEPLKRLPELFKIRRDLYHYFLQYRPDVFIGIDSPDFNLGLELKLRQAGIPVVHYVSPSVWAWRKKRIYKIAKATDLILTLFPFEADFYQQHHVAAKFVGHSFADVIPMQPDKAAARRALNLDPHATYIALLPGSRQQELHYLGELFLETAKLCLQQQPQIKFITSAANTQRDQQFQTLAKQVVPTLPLNFSVGRMHEVLAAADMVLVTSGTATLETMLFKRPMVIAYRMANLTYQIARHLVKVPFVGLPNLLAQEKIVPEFIQGAATPQNFAAALLNYLQHPQQVLDLEKRFAAIHQQLRCDASQTAARAVLDLVQRSFLERLPPPGEGAR